jgi:hypothetical protein
MEAAVCNKQKAFRLLYTYTILCLAGCIGLFFINPPGQANPSSAMLIVLAKCQPGEARLAFLGTRGQKRLTYL